MSCCSRRRRCVFSCVSSAGRAARVLLFALSAAAVRVSVCHSKTDPSVGRRGQAAAAAAMMDASAVGKKQRRSRQHHDEEGKRRSRQRKQQKERKKSTP